MTMEQNVKSYDKDLEKEIGKYLDVNDIEFGHQIKLFDIAKHFFELGLNHSKENNMATEQNTKSYDKALERAKEWLNSEELDLYTCIVESIFPELKESGDERTRKEIIRFIQMEVEDEIVGNKWLAWLKKQAEPVEINLTEFDIRLQALIGKFSSLPKEELIGSLRFWMNAIENDETYNNEENRDEQKEPQVYVTKDSEVITYSENDGYKFVKPKFKENDWTVSNLDGKTRQISEVHFDEYNCYYVVNGKSVNLEEYDRLHHLWTIANIKDGDILTSEDGYPFIYAGQHIYTKYFTAYCGITNDEKFKISDKTELWTNDNVEPATKDQCSFLFQKMHESGYEWDAKMKELNLNEEGYKHMFKNCTNSQYMAYKEKMSGTDIKESKSFWNEEDEKMDSKRC